ncbi:MAG: 50S ribosomal protein L4 [Sedimentisphaerales bacterium]|nr:50S ribosomal protein L4 [Sedimentisphaerales bacterium]
MISLPVYNKEGKEIEALKVDTSAFGGRVRFALLKQAIVMYHANKRVGTAATKNRSMIEGSTRKLYAQKHTGNARAGTIRTAKRVGGGVTFAKIPRDFSRRMPKKQRHLARDSAILSKILSNNVVVIDELKFERPKTKDFAAILDNLKIDRSCLVVINEHDDMLWRSARNIPKIAVLSAAESNAGDICRHAKLLFTKEALVALMNREKESEN